MNTDIEKSISRLRLVLPGCPRPLIVDQLTLSINQFLRETGFVEVRLDSITSVKDQEDYTLALPSGYDGWKILDVISVHRDGVKFYEKKDYIISSDRSTLTLYSIPTENDAGDMIDVLVTIEIDDITDSSFSADPITRYLPHGIPGRAIYSLAQISGRPYSSPDMAVLGLREYNDAVSRALAERTGSELSI